MKSVQFFKHIQIFKHTGRIRKKKLFIYRDSTSINLSKPQDLLLFLFSHSTFSYILCYIYENYGNLFKTQSVTALSEHSII